ncbi:hypothetical protein D3C78_803510 [compost metagenome]
MQLVKTRMYKMNPGLGGRSHKLEQFLIKDSPLPLKKVLCARIGHLSVDARSNRDIDLPIQRGNLRPQPDQMPIFQRNEASKA